LTAAGSGWSGSLDASHGFEFGAKLRHVGGQTLGGARGQRCVFGFPLRADEVG
jgi:hypothetical protein